MRQYRGLTKEGKWVYGWYIEGNNLKDGTHKRHLRSYILQEFPDIRENTIGCVRVDGLVEVIPETVGQSVGLKDVHGKNLDWWKGDIIEFSFQYGFIGALQTETITASITFEQGQYWVGEYPIQRAIDEYGNKIGNIHDNPKLLKD